MSDQEPEQLDGYHTPTDSDNENENNNEILNDLPEIPNESFENESENDSPSCTNTILNMCQVQ